MHTPGFEFAEEVGGGRAGTFCRAKRLRDGREYLVKTAPETGGQLLRRELQLAKGLKLDGVLSPLELVEDSRGFQALLFDPIPGQLLSTRLSSGALPIVDALDVASRLAACLAGLHGEEIVHLDVRPENLFRDEPTGEVWLTGLSRALRVPRLLPSTVAFDTLPEPGYVSPEQTGRIGRVVDYRSDYYSLGVMLFEMLTGRLPFQTDSVLALLHAHVARRPPSPRELRPEIPEPVAEITLKLLAKAAEDRYQGGSGIRDDLNRCLRELRANGSVTSFDLAQQDVPERFELPQKLYGRETELHRLEECLEDTHRSGFKALFVAGDAGVGKTALVRELRSRVLSRRGNFFAVKFGEIQRGGPYSAIRGALRGLVLRLSVDPPEAVARSRERLLERLGRNVEVLGEIVPELELVTGPLSSPPRVPARESRDRFIWSVTELLRLSATPEQPAVLFFDDLQWIDASSLEIFEKLFDPGVDHMLLLGTYRNEEVGEDHRLRLALERLRRQGHAIETLELDPLGLEDVEQLVSEALRAPREGAAALAETVFSKTNGNPFHVGQFLCDLDQRGLIHFTLDDGFGWNQKGIESLSATENVLELTSRKLAGLDAELQQVLSHAAALGDRFDDRILAIVSEMDGERVESMLVTACREGVLVRRGERYEFLHDRVRESAYTAISGPLRAETHLQIARRLRRVSLPGLSTLVLADHWNRASALLEGEEREEAVRANLVAGRDAVVQNAFPSAHEYFSSGLSLLGDEGWKSYELALALHREAAETAFLTGDFKRAHELTADVMANARGEGDALPAKETHIAALTAERREDEAISATLELLAEYGVRLPAEPDSARVEVAFAEAGRGCEATLSQSLDELTEMTTHKSLTACRLLTQLVKTASLGRLTLSRAAAAQLVELSLVEGYSSFSGAGFVIVATAGELMTSAPERAIRIARRGEELFGRFGDDASRPVFEAVFDSFVTSYVTHPRELLVYEEKAHQAMEYGQPLVGAIYGYNACLAALLSGNPLAEMEIFIGKLEKNVRAWGQEMRAAAIARLRGVARRLMAMEPRNEESAAASKDMDDRVRYAGPELMAHVILGERSRALEVAQEPASPMPLFPFDFYRCLASTGAGGEEIAALRDSLAVRARVVPELYQHKLDLVDAERHRLQREFAECSVHYEKAIEGAERQGFVQEGALAAELAATFHFEQGQDHVARLFLQEAASAYERWGATAKVAKLRASFPSMVASSVDVERSKSGRTSASGLDLVAVEQAIAALSSELDLDRLLRKLMTLLLQVSSAEHGFLLRQHDERIWIEASGFLDDIQVEPVVPLEDCSEISHSIVRYVARALQTVVTGDSSRDDRFDADSSLPRERPLSVLCTPILHQDRATAIIYLENNHTRDAFVEQRLGAIRAISTQAAVALENARLHRRLELSESRLRKVLKTAPDPILLVDPSGIIHLANDEALLAFDYEPEQIANRKAMELLPGLLAAGARPTGPLELEGKRRRGGKFPVEVNLSRLATDAGELLCCTIRDVSERKRAESELRRALSEVAKLKERLEAENVYLREEIRGSHDFRELVGESESLRRVLTKVEQVAATDASVLILGETGTGKELVARAIHSRSRRSQRTLVKVNCAALPSTLIEAELFGHEKGAFTGALVRKAGRFELADGGTLFLDEIGDLPLELQSKLLRALQEGEIERLGSTTTQKVDVRIVTATNRDLEKAVLQGSFRSDLYYRLRVFPIKLPALRDRREDIPLLVWYFIEKFQTKIGKRIDKIPAEVMRRLESYHWPGNIRELANVIEHAVIVTSSTTLVLGDSALASGSAAPASVYGSSLEAVEREHILRVMEDCGWKIKGEDNAAERLGVTPSTLRSKLKKLGLARPTA